jgi:hypothetical protein
MLKALKRLIARLRRRRGYRPPDIERDPYARRPVPHKPMPKGRSGAVAVAEPDDDQRTPSEKFQDVLN